MEYLHEIFDFLGCETPDAWIDNALNNQSVMLIDHAHCEKKAAMTAVNNIHMYPDDPELLKKMSRLAREELRHFEQVLKLIEQRGLTFRKMSAARYVVSLRAHVRKQEPDRLVDVLIIGAFIEARSCERFAKLAPHLDDELKHFYESLLKSEARHYQDYLTLANKHAKGDVSERVEFFKGKEAELVEQPDTEFRFHSGPVI